MTFKVGETPYKADTEDTSAWLAFVAAYADVTAQEIDWDDLEERAHFLNMLYVHCETRGTPFPLESTSEILTENINAG